MEAAEEFLRNILSRSVWRGDMEHGFFSGTFLLCCDGEMIAETATYHNLLIIRIDIIYTPLIEKYHVTEPYIDTVIKKLFLEYFNLQVFKIVLSERKDGIQTFFA